MASFLSALITHTLGAASVAAGLACAGAVEAVLGVVREQWVGSAVRAGGCLRATANGLPMPTEHDQCSNGRRVK